VSRGCAGDIAGAAIASRSVYAAVKLSAHKQCRAEESARRPQHKGLRFLDRSWRRISTAGSRCVAGGELVSHRPIMQFHRSMPGEHAIRNHRGLHPLRRRKRDQPRRQPGATRSRLLRSRFRTPRSTVCRSLEPAVSAGRSSTSLSVFASSSANRGVEPYWWANCLPCRAFCARPRGNLPTGPLQRVRTAE